MNIRCLRKHLKKAVFWAPHLPYSIMCAHFKPKCNNIKLKAKWNISY